MAVWSKELPLTAYRCPGLNRPKACDKVASDLGLGDGFLHQ